MSDFYSSCNTLVVVQKKVSNVIPRRLVKFCTPDMGEKTVMQGREDNNGSCLIPTKRYTRVGGVLGEARETRRLDKSSSHTGHTSLRSPFRYIAISTFSSFKSCILFLLNGNARKNSLGLFSNDNVNFVFSFNSFIGGRKTYVTSRAPLPYEAATADA